MSPRRLRLLAECLDNNFITAEDRKGWASGLRGFAKTLEREAKDARGYETVDGEPCDGNGRIFPQ